MTEQLTRAGFPPADSTGPDISYPDIHRRLYACGTQADALAALTATAVITVPGAEWGSITRIRNGSFRTWSATDPEAEMFGAVQSELGAGPCVDATLQRRTVRTDDLRVDPRWPGLRGVTEATGVCSVLSLRLSLEPEDSLAGLNLFSTEPSAFDGAAEATGMLVAALGALAIAAACAREHASQMTAALASSRDIGVALGILMATHKVTRQQAFAVLRTMSQHANRKLREIAVEVGDTGTVGLLRTRTNHCPQVSSKVDPLCRVPDGPPGRTAQRPSGFHGVGGVRDGGPSWPVTP